MEGSMIHSTDGPNRPLPSCVILLSRRFDATTGLLASCTGLTIWWFGVTKPLCLLLIGTSLYVAFLLRGVPTSNAGHRVGGHGFDGLRPENTLEALQDLIRRDNAGPLQGLAYAEFDVHVSDSFTSNTQNGAVRR